MDELCLGKSGEAVLDDDRRIVRPITRQGLALEDFFIGSAQSSPGSLFLDGCQGRCSVGKSSWQECSREKEEQSEIAHHRCWECPCEVEHSALQHMKSTESIVSLND